mmetsp:Transcript_109930/g.328695  ORF Transcript_109930/g.328695 Transcript_109930/m.328695 type:complete len:366 (-) Transcript_109930:49-1146(-)
MARRAMLRLLWLAVLAVAGQAIMQKHPTAAPGKTTPVVDTEADLELPAPPRRAAKDVVYHLHIPKTAGLSFANDALKVLQEHGLRQASREGCFSWQEGNPRVRGATLLLRNPRKHIVSMYDMCRRFESYREAVRPARAARLPLTVEAWLQEWRRLQGVGWHGDFTPPPWPVSNMSTEHDMRKSRILAWSSPPFSPEQSFLDEKDWTSLDGGGTIWHHAKVPFQCYSPLNFQTQRLTCSKPMEWPERPNFELALQRVESTWFVGLVEKYQASVCLLRAKLGEAPLPPYCDCRDPKKWATFQGSHENMVGHTTNFSAMSKETIREIDKLTTLDRQLYKAGMRRFLREIREVEEAHKTKLLCNFTATA